MNQRLVYARRAYVSIRPDGLYDLEAYIADGAGDIRYGRLDAINAGEVMLATLRWLQAGYLSGYPGDHTEIEGVR